MQRRAGRILRIGAAQADALGQIAGGPVVGWIGTVRSLRAALVTTGLVLSPALLLFARALGQGKPGEMESPVGGGGRSRRSQHTQ